MAQGRAIRPLLVLLLCAALLCAGAWALLGSLHSMQASLPKKNWTSLGKHGEQPGEFEQPRGITGFPDGSFVVVDRAARVQHFAADGKPLALWSMKDHDLGNPKGLCALPDGNLLVCDTHYGRVLEMTLEGDLVKIWGAFGQAPGQFTHPLSAAVDAARGRAYVVEYGAYNDRVQVFKLDGAFVKCFGVFGSRPGEFQRPSGIAVDSSGNIYVADAVNHRIQKFDPDGKLLKAFGEMGSEPGQLKYPYDIAYSPDGLLYVAEFNNHRVSVFSTDGVFVRTLGGPGSQSGGFFSPWSLTVDARGRLLVSDTGNHRVQIRDVGSERRGDAETR
jgi:sugar lactone lactonase YvrE